MKAASQVGLGLLLLIISLLILHPARSQKIFDPPNVVLDYRCPKYALPADAPIIMRAEILGAKALLDEKQAKRINFRWEVSEGKLMNGQGTGKVNIDISGIAKNHISCVAVKLEVDGAPPSMEREKTCKLIIDPMCNAPALFDQYGAVSAKQEKQHLDRLVEYLKNAGANASAYVISYAGRYSCHYEAQWRADRAKRYLVEEKKVPADHIITEDGGVRESWSVDVFVQAHGNCGPLLAPTLQRDDAEMKGQCAEKYKESP